MCMQSVNQTANYEVYIPSSVSQLVYFIHCIVCCFVGTKEVLFVGVSMKHLCLMHARCTCIHTYTYIQAPVHAWVYELDFQLHLFQVHGCMLISY